MGPEKPVQAGYPRRLDVVVKFFFALGFLYGAALYLLHDLAMRPFSLSAWLCYFVVAGSAAALFMKPHRRIQFFFVVASSLVVLLAVETTLEVRRLREDRTWLAQVASRTGTDPMRKQDMLADLRAAGTDAVGLRCPLYSSTSEDKSLLPLAGWPFRHTLLGNELGYPATYLADRYGFNNPDEAHTQRNGRTAVVLLGDSFAQGVAVRPDANAAAVLRHRGYDVLNLGCAGNGPLAALASWVEYGRTRAPDVVVWFYLESNDLSDLAYESGTLLARYLEPGFSQQLVDRTPEIVRFLDRLPVPEYRAPWPPGRVTTAANVRALLSKVTSSQRSRIEQLRDVTIALQRSVTQRGARLLAVYLPDPSSVTGSGKRDACFISAPSCKAQVLQVFYESSIPVLDFEAVLSGLDDPLAVFSFRIGSAARGHYTEEGYALLGNSIADELARHAN